MKYQVGDLIDRPDVAGLGYISNITQDGYGIYITWFDCDTYYDYNSAEIDRWIMHQRAKHYPIGKQ